MAAYAQNNLSLEQVKAKWQIRDINVSAGAKPNIIQLVQAFQQAFPTYSGAEIIKFSKSKAPYDNVDKVVDLARGYVYYSEDDPDSENDEQLGACVWNRSNGHKLFAVSLHRFSSEIEVLCFYDFNPQTQTLKPEKSLANLFTPSFPGCRYRVWLPREGKNMQVEEFFGGVTIKHDYGWNGSRPANPQITIDEIGNLQSTFNSQFMADSNQPFSQYTMVDVDKDGVPELWLTSSDESYQAVFSIFPVCQLLGGQDDRTFLSFYKSAVCSAGACGALCSSMRYVLVKKSSIDSRLVEETVLNAEGTEESTTYELDGEEISEKDGEKRVKALGEEITYKPKWRQLADF